MHIQTEDLNELEFPELLAEISPYAFSKKIAEKIMAIRPFGLEEAELSLKKTAEYLSSFESDNAIPFSEYEDIEQELKLMLIENFRLDNTAFLKIKGLTEQIARLQKFYPVYEDLFLHLNHDVKDLEYRKEIIDKIDKVFNRFGEVKSEASPLLKTLRGEISHAKKAIQENFNRALTALTSTDFLDDIRESIMDDQRVLAVKSGYKKRVPGRVLGLSKT